MIALAEITCPKRSVSPSSFSSTPASPDMMNYLLPELASGHLAVAQHGLLLLKRSVTMCWRYR